MYFKDRVRTLVNKFFKIDKEYLCRIKLLKQIPVLSFDGTEYETSLYNESLFLRNLSSDFEVYDQVILDEEYSFSNELYKTFFKGLPTVIFDIGANIGLTSLYYSNKYPECKIFSFEAESNNYKQLEKNLKSYPNIKPLHLAIWFEETKLNISSDFRDKRSWAFQVSKSEGNQLTQGLTLLQAMSVQEVEIIDILKIDIEGAEKQVLFDDDTINQVLDRTKIVCVEIHDEAVSRIAITNKLKDLGFDIYAKAETLFAVKK